jgi:hypothetical protein
MYKNIITSIQRFFKERPSYFLDRQDFLEKNNRVLLISAGLFVVILLIRSWENFSHPAFYVEDASYYFWINYDTPFKFEHIFRNPNGYYNVFNNFVAQLIDILDVRLQPLAYQTVALTISAATVIMFGRTGLIKNKFLLLVMPLAIGLSGFNHIHYYTTITFQMYVLVITLLLVLLWEKPNSFKNLLLVLLLIPVLVWSGPYSVLGVPFAISFMVLFRGKNLIMLWTIAVTIAYVLLTTGAKGSGIVPEHLFTAFYQNLWFETLVTDVFMMGLRGNANIEKVLLLAAIFGPALYLIRRDTLYLRILLLLMVVIVCTPAPLLLSNKFSVYQRVYPCHIFTAQIAWVLFVLIVLDRVLLRCTGKFHQIASFVMMAMVLLFVITDNVKNERKRKHEILYNTPEFLRTIKKYEQLGLAEKNQNVIISADGLAIFDPRIIVGSRLPDAETIKKIYIPQRTKQ